MKILVTFAGELGDNKLKAFAEGVAFLKRQGHNVTVSDSNSKDNIDKVIRDTDIVITETSATNLKTGFDIAKALNEKKIVIALQNEGKSSADFEYITKNKYRNLLVVDYSTKTITDVVDTALDKAKKLMDTKFILIISPEIDRYLDWASQTKRMHKAQIVRNAVENTMKKDRDYKNYLSA